jgi:hypothetical protein
VLDGERERDGGTGLRIQARFIAALIPGKWSNGLDRVRLSTWEWQNG